MFRVQLGLYGAEAIHLHTSEKYLFIYTLCYRFNLTNWVARNIFDSSATHSVAAYLVYLTATCVQFSQRRHLCNMFESSLCNLCVRGVRGNTVSLRFLTGKSSGQRVMSFVVSQCCDKQPPLFFFF